MENPNKKWSNWYDKEISIFTTCFLISFSLWLMIVLTKDYNSNILVKADYTGLPEGKVLSNKLPNELRIEIITTGFVLLKNALNSVQQRVEIDAAPTRKLDLEISGEYTISLQSQISQLSEQLGTEYKIKSVFPENLSINLTTRAQKVVPVKYHLSYSFLPQFSFEDTIHLIPSRVLIKGPKHILDNIDHIETDSINISSINSDITKVIPFKINEELKQVEVKGTRGVIIIKVDKFTEAEIEIPIQGITEGPYQIKTFPPKVKVKYMVTLSKFKTVKNTDFKVVANIKGVDLNSVSKLALQLVQYPSTIKNPILLPGDVEFILNKR